MSKSTNKAGPALDPSPFRPPSASPVAASDQQRAKAARVLRLLLAAYGRPSWMPALDPVSELIATILSQHTSDLNSHRAFAKLRAVFATWEEVRDAPVERIAEAVRSGGMANQKAQRIKETLAYLAARVPSASGVPQLEFLADLDLAEAKAWLRSIPGVGPKTAACVLMFALNRPAMPVDTHVFRVARRLGLIDGHLSVEHAHDQLETMVDPADVYTFHVDLITHGRRVCKAPRPLCAICTLREECDYYQGTLRGPTLPDPSLA